jgi:probable O-glycosylation ligase (exosortase A-associated)
LRDLILTIVIPLAFCWAFTSGPRAVLVLVWVCFQRPQDFSYGVWEGKPVFQLALLIALASNFFHGTLRFKITPLLAVMMALLTWLTISTQFAFDVDHARDFYRAFVPSLWAMPIVLTATIHDLKLLKHVIWVAAGSIAVNATKAGISLTAGGGAHVTEQISGFVGDNNVFGLVLCLVVGIVIGMRNTIPEKRWAKIALYGALAANVICIIYTKSRGALLTLGVISFVASWKGGKFLKSMGIMLLVVGAGLLVVPGEYFDRLGTLKNVSADESAMGRVENWGLAWNEAAANPLFGVGPDNHILYNRAKGAEVTLRVAHSVYFQTLGELGFPALFLYITFVLMAIGAAARAWRATVPIAKKYPDLAWTRDVSFWMMCSFVGYVFGAGFLNMFYIEFPWTAMILGGLLLPMVMQEVKRRETEKLATPETATQEDEAPKPIWGRRQVGSRARPPKLLPGQRRKPG